MEKTPLPLPSFYLPERAGEVYRVEYETLAQAARRWAKHHHIQPASNDTRRISFVGIDIQNTFCTPGFELFVGGQSGNGAVEDNQRLAAFLYEHLDTITEIVLTLDTHQAAQIFHAVFLVDAEGNHPGPHTQIQAEDIQSGRWRFNPALEKALEASPGFGQAHLAHYTQALLAKNKYNLTIWPYHAMLGGIGHALAAIIEEAVFFHSMARYSPTRFILKGSSPFTEHYSAIGPEVNQGPNGETLANRSGALMQILERSDVMIIAGQAKSHCVAWTVQDLLAEIQQTDPTLARRVYLLEDCTSPVVVPGVVDFSAAADEAYAQFAAAGIHIVRTSDSLSDIFSG